MEAGAPAPEARPRPVRNKVARPLLGPVPKRAAARVLDWLVLAGAAVAFRAAVPKHSDLRWALLLLPFLYEVLPVARWGQTLGKRVFGLRVVSLRTGRPPTAGRSLGRYLTWAALGYLPVVRVFAPLWWALVFGSALLSLDFQGAHDVVAGTVVLRANASLAPKEAS